MATGDGVITRKDIITDEALSFGKEYKKNVEEAIKANDELINQFKVLLKVSGDYRKAQDSYDYKKAKQEESLANQKILNELKQMATLEKELERIKQEKAKTEKELLRVAQENIRLSRQQAAQQRSTVHLTMEERVQRQLANKAEKEAVLNKMGLIGAYQKLNAQRTEAKKRLLDLIASEKASTAEIKKAQREFDVLDKRVRKADTAVGDFTKNVGNYKSAFSGLSNLMGAFGVVGGITGVVMLGKSIYQTTKEIQAQEIALRMLSETEETYAKNKEFLTRISEQYGLELMTTTNAYKNYFASAKTSIEEGKLSFEEMQMIFEKVSKSASMLGLSVENQEGAFLALSQMLSKGTVQSEELRGQLGERLPGAFEVMAKALGVTTMELGKMLENGEVLAADVLPKFAEAYEKAIGADQIERTETLAAAQNRATNKWTEFVESLNSGQGVVSQVGMGFFNLTGNIIDLIGAKQKLSEEIYEEQLQLNGLINKITSLNEDNRDRQYLIDQLKTSYPGFIKYIQDENYSNDNLRKTLFLVNEEYRNRILLQKQVEVLERAKEKRDKAESAAATSRLQLYNKLREINTDYNLGVQLTIDNVEEAADKIQQLAKKDLGLFDQLRIEKLQKDIEIFSNSAEKLNEEVEKHSSLASDIQNQTGLNTEAQEKQRKVYEKTISTVKELSAEASKLGLVAGRDFHEYSISALQDAINKKKTGPASETDAQRKKREAEARRAQREYERLQRKADKLETERLKKLRDSYDAEIDLEIYRLNVLTDIHKEESVNEKNTQDERYDALMTYFQLEEELLRKNLEKQLTLSRSFQKDRIAFTEEEINNMVNGVSYKADITNEELLILEKFYNDQEKLRKRNEKGLQENLDFEVNILKKQAQEKVKKITSQNNKDEAGEINTLSIGNNLTDVENYEKTAYEIKRKYLLKNLEDELAVYNSIIENEKKKGKVNQDILDKQLELENKVREFKTQSHIESLEKAKEIEDKFIEIGENIKNALVDLTNAIFDNRIQRIDEDIERTNEQYEKQIELYEGDAARQKLIREEQEREREKLEAKKRKEQHKQAVFNKAMSIADIGFNTAVSIMKGYADLGPIGGSVFAVLASILGTVQTATVLATPIPKYKTGRKGGKEEIAIVGDGGVHEVIEHTDGSAEITPNRDTLVKLLEGDIVHSSVEAYRKSKRNKLNNDLQKDIYKYQMYMKETSVDTKVLENKIDELIKITKEKKLTSNTTVNVPKIDLNHELWRLKQLGYFK